MKKIDQLAVFAGLQSARISANADITDHLMSQDGVAEKLGLKRIQFEATPTLYDSLEGICSLLDCSKREFLQAAVIDAIRDAEAKFLATFEEATGRGFGTLEEGEPC